MSSKITQKEKNKLHTKAMPAAKSKKQRMKKMQIWKTNAIMLHKLCQHRNNISNRTGRRENERGK